MSVCLCVYVCLPVCLRFSDRLQLDVTDSVSQWVDVTGCGQGIAVITIPTLPRPLRLGPCYCGHVARYEFTIVNKGRRQYTVFATNADAAAAAAAVKSCKYHVRQSPLMLMVMVMVNVNLYSASVTKSLKTWLKKSQVFRCCLKDS